MSPTWTRSEELNRWTTASALIAVVTVLGAAVTGVLPAQAGPAAPPPADRELLGVSCVTARNCLAVGIDRDALKGAGGPLAETWNGTAWRTAGVRLPRGATTGILDGVSCVSAVRCVAVGSSYDKGSGKEFALAETWNGRAWTPAQLPAPGGADASLSGVSCTSGAGCVAVGSYASGGPAAPLAEIWDGRRWTQTRPPASGGGLAISGLDAVSCASPARCVAVGVAVGPPVAVIESWNGKAWSMRKGPPLPGDIGAVQTGVSCRSAGSCVAVGFGMFATATVSLSDIWNGKSWGDVSVPLPGGGMSGSHLYGVSCAAVNRCVAVGTIESYTKGGRTAAAVTWNGKGWAVTSVPAPGKGKDSLFQDVACLSATDCVAVGQASRAGSTNGTGTGLSGFWNGKSWRMVAAE
jgi:hypothetical protein